MSKEKTEDPRVAEMMRALDEPDSGPDIGATVNQQVNAYLVTRDRFLAAHLEAIAQCRLMRKLGDNKGAEQQFQHAKRLAESVFAVDDLVRGEEKSVAVRARYELALEQRKAAKQAEANADA